MLGLTWKRLSRLKLTRCLVWTSSERGRRGSNSHLAPASEVGRGYLFDVARTNSTSTASSGLVGRARLALRPGPEADRADGFARRSRCGAARRSPTSLRTFAALQPEMARLGRSGRGSPSRRSRTRPRSSAATAVLVPELEAAVALPPLRERLRVQLMTALYRAGRQADALAAFHDARRALLDELGIEPGPALRDTHEAILQPGPRARPAGASATAAHRPPGDRAPALAGAAPPCSSGRGRGGRSRRLGATAGGPPPHGSPTRQATRSSRSTPGPRRSRGVCPAGSTPTEVAAGAGGAWALNADDGTLTRVAGPRSSPRTFSAPPTRRHHRGPGGVWALTGDERASVC